MVRRPPRARSASASATTWRISLTPARTAEKGTKRAPATWAMRKASVVLPVPGGGVGEGGDVGRDGDVAPGELFGVGAIADGGSAPGLGGRAVDPGVAHHHDPIGRGPSLSRRGGRRGAA